MYSVVMTCCDAVNISGDSLSGSEHSDVAQLE